MDNVCMFLPSFGFAPGEASVGPESEATRRSSIEATALSASFAVKKQNAVVGRDGEQPVISGKLHSSDAVGSKARDRVASRCILQENRVLVRNGDAPTIA